MPTQPKSKQVNIPALMIRAAVMPETIDEENRRVQVTWSTGARVLRKPFWDEPYMEELSLDPAHVDLGRLNNGAPLLNTHGAYSLRDVIGVVEEAVTDGAEGSAWVRFSEREEVEPIFRDVKAGILQNISVGYRVYRYEEVQERDDKMKVLRAVDWEPLELSVVPIGADDGAGFRSGGSSETNLCTITSADSAHNTYEERTMPKNTTDEERGLAGDEGGAPTAGKTYTADQVAQAARKGAEDERKRQAGIRIACRNAKLGEEFAQSLIDEGVTIEAARATIIDKLADNDEQTETRSQHRIEGGDDAFTRFRAGATEAVLIRAGLQKNDGQNEFRGFSLRELARESLALRGQATRGMSALDMIGRAFTHSGGDFGNIIANVAHKAMLVGYEEADETFQVWTRPGTLTDFKPASRIDLNAFPSLREVRPGAEYKYATIGDRGETIQLATYGELFSIDRQTIINDDLDAFSRVPRLMGRAAIRTVGDLVYAILTSNPQMSDGTVLFHADHNNLLTGAAITTSSVDAMQVAMGTQKDRSNNTTALNIMLAYLLVPRALKGTAMTVRDSQFEVTGASKANTTPNWVNGTFDVVADARLDAASASNWYGAANPNSTDTIEVAYLDGQQEPLLEQRDGWSVDGVEFKVRLDAGVKALAWEGMAKNPN